MKDLKKRFLDAYPTIMSVALGVFIGGWSMHQHWEHRWDQRREWLIDEGVLEWEVDPETGDTRAGLVPHVRYEANRHKLVREAERERQDDEQHEKIQSLYSPDFSPEEAIAEDEDEAENGS